MIMCLFDLFLTNNRSKKEAAQCVVHSCMHSGRAHMSIYMRCLCTGEAGILVAPLTAMNQFLGYAGNKVQSEKKLLRDVFKAGDVYFNTGDLLLLDCKGFLYFNDRVGDTFRYLTVSIIKPVLMQPC